MAEMVMMLYIDIIKGGSDNDIIYGGNDIDIINNVIHILQI